MKTMLVSAVALIDKDGRVLISKRPVGKPYEGLWEFPGGKVEQGETTSNALIRELHEEIGIETWNNCLAPLTFATHIINNTEIILLVYVCRKWEGIPAAKEGQTLKWITRKQLKDFSMPPCDKPIVAFLNNFL